jgi:uncharacterized protein (DUF885 family)
MTTRRRTHLALLAKFAATTFLPMTIACAALSGCALTKQILPDTYQSSKSTESRKLHEIFESFFEAELALFPTFATEIGDHRYDDQLEIAISEEHIAAQRRLLQHTLKRTAEIKVEAIEARERLYLEVLSRALKVALDGFAFKQRLMPVRQLASLAVEFPLLGSGAGAHPFRTVTDYENFLKRIDGFETWVDTAIANMRQGSAVGVTQPRPVIERTLPQLRAMIVSDARTSLFYQPVVRMPGDFSEADRNRLTRGYTEAIEQRIVPAYRRLLSFLEGEYLDKTRRTVALSDLPDGKAWYEYLVKTQTTTDLTPEEIFQLGMSEIARIKTEMDRMREEQNFTGSLSDFSDYLTDHGPRGYQSRSGLIQGYETIRRTVAPGLAKLFGHAPKAPFEIRTIEEFRERSAPSQYWPAAPDGSRPGIFYVNAANIETNPRAASEPLYLHEAVPGHHFQISLQQERDDLPRFQRFADYTAFVEGWALYAESLGAELGLYKEPSQYFSRLSSELFRAARLVVDVGLHRKGWSREQAIKFLMDTVLSSESGATLEVDRYIALPAQALSYKIGQLKIAAIRSKAEKALGAKFDIRAFHDELLRDGALPLDVLERKMDRWIEATRR